MTFGLKKLVCLVAWWSLPVHLAASLQTVQIGFGRSGGYSVNGGSILTTTAFNMTSDGQVSLVTDSFSAGAGSITVTLRPAEASEPGIFDNCAGTDSDCQLRRSSSDLTANLGGAFGQAGGVGVQPSVNQGNRQVNSSEVLLLTFSQPVTILMVILADVQTGEGGTLGTFDSGSALSLLKSSNLSALGGTTTYSSQNGGIFTTGAVEWIGSNFYFTTSSADGWFLQSVAFNFDDGAVPEPSTYMLMGTGLAAFFAFARLRRRQAQKRG